MGDKHVFFHTLTVLMSNLAFPLFSPSLFSPPPLPISASICDVGPPHLWLQDKTICSKMCATLLLRSPGLQFRAPLDMMEPMLSGHFLSPVPHSWALLLSQWVSFCWIEDGSLGLDHRGFCHPFESYLTYGFPLSFPNKWGGHLNSNAGECLFFLWYYL